MRKIYNIYLVLFLSAFAFQTVYSQEKELKKANELYDNLAYVEAIKVYEKIAKDGFENQELLERLGNSYYFNAEYNKALPWYEKLFNNKDYTVAPEYYYRYAQSLKSDEQYEKADAVMDKFSTLTKLNDNRALIFEENKDYQSIIEKNSGRLDLVPVAVNTEFSEYGTAFYGDNQVVFTANNSPKTFKKTSHWTGDSFYNLYVSHRDSMSLTNKQVFSSVLNSKFNESTATFTKDGNTVYFTRNNYLNKKVGMDDDTILLKIYKSTKKTDGTWGEVVELPFNSDFYNVAHPALSPDEKYLYFSSDMSGSLGSTDIYRVKILDNGYGEPENLGSEINTDGRESFPFVSKNNVLYYSSEGLPGLGGLDIFAAQILDKGNFSKPINIGRPGNSPDDDFCFVIDSDSKIGFLSSNRAGGKGKDDIYSFYENIPLRFSCAKLLSGVVKNAQTMELLPESRVTLIGREMNAVSNQTTGVDAKFAFNDMVDCYESYYYLRGEKEGFETAEVKVTTEGEEDVYYEILLTPKSIPIKEGDDLAKTFNIKEIYFDFDKSNIRPDAAVELAKVVDVMKEYPNMILEVRSHTDSRGSDSYNESLSNRRAKSTVKWIIEHGINSSRISGKGYGETQLTNKCSNGVPCSKEAHQANRRSEFIIIKI